MTTTIGQLVRAPKSTAASEGPLQRDLSSLRSGMRPAFTPDLQRFVDGFMRSRPQDRGTMQDYGMLYNLCSELEQKYATTLSVAERSTLESAKKGFLAKATRGGIPYGLAKLPRRPVEFPSLATQAGQPQGFGAHVRSSDGRMKLTIATNEPHAPHLRIDLTRALDPAYFQSVIELNVDRARVSSRVTAGQSAADILNALGSQLTAQDPSLRLRVHPWPSEELGVERATLEVYR